MTALILTIVILIGIYVLTLKLNPWVRCSRCKNVPKRKAGRSATHITSLRAKAPQQLRFGRRFLRDLWPGAGKAAAE